MAAREFIQRKIGKPDGLVARERGVFLFVALDEPAAVQTDFEKSVPIYDIVAVDFLDGKPCTFDVRRIGVEIGPVDTCAIASALKKNLAVVPGKRPHPFQKSEAVRAFRLVRHPLALAHSGSAAVLHNVGVTAFEIRFLGLQICLEIDFGIFQVRISLNNDGALYALLRADSVCVEPDTIAHRHHLFKRLFRRCA